MNLDDIGIEHAGIGYVAYLGWTSGSDAAGTVGFWMVACILLWAFTGSQLVLPLFIFGITIVPLFSWTINLFFKEDIVGGIIVFIIMMGIGAVEFTYLMRMLLGN